MIDLERLRALWEKCEHGVQGLSFFEEEEVWDALPALLDELAQAREAFSRYFIEGDETIADVMERQSQAAINFRRELAALLPKEE